MLNFCADCESSYRFPRDVSVQQQAKNYESFKLWRSFFVAH